MNSFCEVKKFTFEKKDLLVVRSSTDGFQPKFITKDRKFFVKGQAVISGVVMNDWLVELIASSFCKQLEIPVVYQNECDIDFAGVEIKGVYSSNFELEGYSFLSFESLLGRVNKSSKEDYFIKLNTIEKMKWIANELANISALSYSDCLTYVINLSVIDCLVGNCDRHTKNFGLFYKKGCKFSIPLLFDNGMGLFENDYYRDKYETFEAAMRTVYVSPYGEDPFDMLQLLKENFDLSHLKFQNLKFPASVPNDFARTYLEKMFKEVGV